MRKLLPVLLASSLFLPPQLFAQTPQPAGTQDLTTGIRQVEEGDLEAAVITLDTVIQRLKETKGHESELATAHLYLSMAHLGLSQWERAKGEMREAWRNDQKLTLDPKKFPPRVIQLYEQTKQETKVPEAIASPKPPPAAAPQAAPQPAPKAAVATPAAPPKKSGSKKVPLLIGAGVVAVGGGVALAAGGGSSAGGGTSTSTCNNAAAFTASNARFERTEIPCPVGTTSFTNTVLFDAVNPRCVSVDLAGSAGTAMLTLTVIEQSKTSNPLTRMWTQGFPNTGPPQNSTQPTSVAPSSTIVVRVPTGGTCNNVGTGSLSNLMSDGQTGGYFVMSGRLDLPTSAGNFVLQLVNTERVTFP